MNLIEHHAGDTVHYEFTVLEDGARPADGIAGWQLYLTVRGRLDTPDAAPLYEISTGGGAITILDPIGCRALAKIAPELTTSVKPGRYAAWVTTIQPNGKRDTAAFGPYIINPRGKLSA